MSGQWVAPPGPIDADRDVVSHTENRSAKCPVCGKSVRRTKRFHGLAGEAPGARAVVYASLRAAAEVWQPQMVHDKCTLFEDVVPVR